MDLPIGKFVSFSDQLLRGWATEEHIGHSRRAWAAAEEEESRDLGSPTDVESGDLARKYLPVVLESGDSPVEVESGDLPMDWKSLPMDMLRIILTLLPVRDLIRSSAVSKTWRQAAGEVHRPQHLWLGVWGTRDFYSFSDNCVYTLPPLPDDLASYEYYGNHDDWLILVPSTIIRKEYLINCCFYNHFTTTQISLPVPVPFKSFPIRIILSSSPLDPSCKAAFVCQSHCRIGLTNLYHEEGKDESIVITYGKAIIHMAFYNGHLYCLTLGGHLHWVDTSSQNTSFILPPPKPPLPLWLRERAHLTGQYCLDFRLLLFQGQLMMVCFFLHYGGRTPFAIFKADFQFRSWELVGNLSGQAILCVVNGSHVSLAPMTAPESLDIGGDCIYLIGWSHYHDLLIRVSKLDMNQYFEMKTTPPIWRPMFLPHQSQHQFFLTHKSIFTSGSWMEKPQ